MSINRKATAVKKTRWQEGKPISEGRMTRGQEGKLFNKSCHPEFISGSVHSEKRKLPWNKMLKHLTDTGSQGSSLACSLCKVQHDKFGFTLAEVLITLGIIGVVAAITIPNLISNYQKKAWTAQLKKSYATLNQGFRRMLAEEGASALSQTETFQSIGGGEDRGGNKNCRYDDVIDSENCKDFYYNLGKYFKITDIKKTDGFYWSSLNKDLHLYLPNPSKKTTMITLIDGTTIWLFNFETNGYVHMYFDVNGVKKPNIVGRDIFRFIVLDNGIVYPYGSKILADDYYAKIYGEDADNYYWKTSSNADQNCENDGQSHGYGCAGRVLEEGKMNY